MIPSLSHLYGWPFLYVSMAEAMSSDAVPEKDSNFMCMKCSVWAGSRVQAWDASGEIIFSVLTYRSPIPRRRLFAQ